MFRLPTDWFKLSINSKRNPSTVKTFFEHGRARSKHTLSTVEIKYADCHAVIGVKKKFFFQISTLQNIIPKDGKEAQSTFKLQITQFYEAFKLQIGFFILLEKHQKISPEKYKL